MINKALLFSGGKDSLACLFLLREEIEDMYVIWVNTGMNYPETLQIIDQVKEFSPHFVEVKVDRQDIKHGHTCCLANLGLPAWYKMKELGVSIVYRGQRNSETLKSEVRNGFTHDGITIIHPIEEWSKEDVLNYLSGWIDLPAHYSIEHSSLDCYDCTGYPEHSQDRIEYTKQNHPIFFAAYQKRLEKDKHGEHE